MPQTWFITGSSRGLGLALAEAVLAAGHRLVATARKPEQLHDLVARYGDRARAVGLDVTDPAAARAAVQEAVEAFGRLDVVVNNAGYGDIAAIEDATDEEFRAQIETDFFGVVNVTRAALPVLRRQGSGHFVQISSIGGRSVTHGGLAAYQSAKWAVAGFSEVLAQEVAPFGVKVTVVEPGGLRTEFTSESSMAIPPVSEPYRGTVGLVAEGFRASLGRQDGDPAKAAEVILGIGGLDDPPLRLLLGSDAVAMAAAADRARIDADAKWRHLSESIAFDTGEERATTAGKAGDATSVTGAD